MQNFNSNYDLLSSFYSKRNIGWADLQKHQKLVLIQAYKKKLNIGNNSFNEVLLVKDIVKDINKERKYDESESNELSENLRLRFAM